MRTVRISPSGNGSIHPLGEQLTAEPSITRDALHSVELLADGTVLEAAVEAGRYRATREATPSHVADAVGVSASTAGEQLRKVAERLFTELVR